MGASRRPPPVEAAELQLSLAPNGTLGCIVAQRRSHEFNGRAHRTTMHLKTEALSDALEGRVMEGEDVVVVFREMLRSM